VKRSVLNLVFVGPVLLRNEQFAEKPPAKIRIIRPARWVSPIKILICIKSPNLAIGFHVPFG
jgi:hypothetical protein